MAWFDKYFNKRIDEAIKAFENKAGSKLTKGDPGGEGIDDLAFLEGYGQVGTLTLNKFYNRYINKMHQNEVNKIMTYRSMADAPEIADIIEDACNEATQIDSTDDGTFILDIRDETLSRNENITNILHSEFNELFYNRLDIDNKIWDLFRTFLVDGRLYYERILSINNRDGIANIKKLPSETMDIEYDPKTGKITTFYQYLTQSSKKPSSRAEAEQNKGKIIIFEPAQIGYINYGLYGVTRYDVLGFLEKAKVPYNQLKLLETSVIIYRIVRSPERLVFKIDTGNMPRDKAMKFVEKIKTKFIKKQSYDPTTGNLTQEPEVLCIRHDTEIPLLDGRFLTLDEIIKEHNEGKEHWVYTVNKETHNIEPGKIKRAMITRPNEQMVRVHYDNGAFIDTTPDHKFILRDGSECRADMLQEGTALMPLYTRMGFMGTKKVEYEQVYTPSDDKWRFTHRVVANNIYGKYSGIVHHKNFDRFNNSPDNLQIMTNEEHHHMHGENVKKMFKDPEYRKKHSEWVTKTNIIQNKAAKMLEVLNIPEVRERQKEAARKHKTEWFSNEENRTNFSKKKSFLIDETAIKMMCDIFIESGSCSRDKLLKVLSNNEQFMGYLEELNKDQCINNKQFDHLNKGILLRMVDEMGFDDYVDFRMNFAGYMNHRVVRIEYLDERDDCGCIEVEGNHNFAISFKGAKLSFASNSILENFFLPTSSDGRGSSIEAVGGNVKGFTELDDVYYFAKKLYRALKYPMSRVEQQSEGQSANIVFGGSNAGQITRDEIKWAKFLERQQNIFCREFEDLFLLHLEFKGLKKQYKLNKGSFELKMTPPSHYRQSMEQAFLEQSFNNYNALSNNAEFSKYYLIKRYLKWTDLDLKDNKAGFKKDKQYLLTTNDEFAEANSGNIGAGSENGESEMTEEDLMNMVQ